MQKGRAAKSLMPGGHLTVAVLGFCLLWLWGSLPALAGHPASVGNPRASGLQTPVASLPPSSAAADIENEPLFGPAATEHAYHPLSKLLPLILSLGLVCIVVLVLLPIFLSKTQPGARKSGASGPMMKIIDRQVLAPQKIICLVEVAGRYLLLGISDRQISTLTELDPAAVDARLAEKEQGATSVIPGPLGAWLGRRWLPGRK